MKLHKSINRWLRFINRNKEPPVERDEYLFSMASKFHSFLNNGHDLNGLKDGLDLESKGAIDRLLSNYEYIYTHNMIPVNIWNPDDFTRAKGVPKEFSALDDIFIEHSGLIHLPEKAKEYVRNKDFLDCGACNGDSALMLKQYSPKSIHSFEPDAANFRLLTANIRKYGIPAVPIRMGIYENSGTMKLSQDGAASHMDMGGEEITMITIDEYVSRNNLHIGLIKMDIEGCELSAVRGALETIKKFRPIITLSIYHSPQDLFHIKPLIEKEIGGYSFLFRHLCKRHPTYETNMIAYPNEIERSGEDW